MKDNLNKICHNKKIVSFIMSFTVYVSLCFQGILKSYNMLSILLFITIFYFIYKIDYKHKYQKGIRMLSIVFSFILLIGRILYNFRYNPVYDSFYELFRIKNIVYFLGNFFLIYNVLSLVVPKIVNYKNDNKYKINHIFIISFLIILTCYIVYYIIYYPAIMTNDSLTELQMILNLQPITDHHTVIHILFMMIPFKFGHLFSNNINFCIGLISIIQITIMSLILAYSISFLYKRNVPKKILVFLLLYYALLPVNGFYSITMWKDIIFSCSVVLLTIECIKLVERKNNITLKNSYSFIIVSLLTVFTRNNAIYMYIILSIISIIIFRKQIKVIITMILIVFSSYIIIKGPVYKVFNINTSSSSEYIAIPLQQVGRMVYKDVKLTKYEKETINKLIPVKTLKEVYNPEIVDPIKFNKEYNIKEFEQNKFKYLKLWFNLCIKHPKIAVESYLISTLGYWYPGVEYWVTTAKIDPNELGIHNSSFVSSSFRNKFSKIMDNNLPIIGFFNCIGFCFWIIIIFAYITTKKKNKYMLYAYIPIFGIWVTMLLATPVFAEFRYIYSGYLCLPIFIGIPFFNKNNK